jgi:hypothetical protein
MYAHVISVHQGSNNFISELCKLFQDNQILKMRVKVLPNQALHHEEVWGFAGIDPHFLTSTPEECQWSSSCPGCFFNKEIPPLPIAYETE